MKDISGARADLEQRIGDPTFRAATKLVTRDIDYARLNRNISQGTADAYKRAAIRSIYSTPKTRLAEISTQWVDFVQENFLGMKPLYGVPLRRLVGPITESLTTSTLESMQFDSEKQYSREDAREVMKEAGVDQETVYKWMKKGQPVPLTALQNEFLAEEIVMNPEAVRADPSLKRPFKLHSFYTGNTQEENKAPWKKAVKKGTAAAGAAIFTLASLAGCIGDDDNGGGNNPPSYPRDADGDYINRTIELEHGLDPKDAYSHGGVHDFLRLYVYPHFFTDKNVTIHDFKEAIPDVEPKYWNNTDGGFYEEGKYTNISLVDPLFQHYADKVHIEWKDNEQYGKIGHLRLDDSPVFKKYGRYNSSRSMAPPIYYLTHGRKGICVTSATANDAIFKYKGCPSTLVQSLVSGDGHTSVEVEIDEEIYVVNYNLVAPREDLDGNTFYVNKGWDTRDYNADWAIIQEEEHN